MYSLILKVSIRYLKTLLIIFSIFLLLRGHNNPGGGFVGGLMAASAFLLVAMGKNVKKAKKVLGFPPRIFIGVGLCFALLAGVLALCFKKEFLSSLWVEVEIPILGIVALGSSLIFDLGVYFVVLGATLMLILGLLEEEAEI